MHSSNKHYVMPKWGIFNASVLLNEHGHHRFFISKLKFSYDKYLVDLTKFERKSIVTFISEELP